MEQKAGDEASWPQHIWEEEACLQTHGFITLGLNSALSSKNNEEDANQAEVSYHSHLPKDFPLTNKEQSEGLSMRQICIRICPSWLGGLVLLRQ